MIETYTVVEELIMSEIRKHRFQTFSNKDLINMHTNIKLRNKINDEDFSEGIQSLITKKRLLFKISDSGIPFYQLSEELKAMLHIE